MEFQAGVFATQIASESLPLPVPGGSLGKEDVQYPGRGVKSGLVQMLRAIGTRAFVGLAVASVWDLGVVRASVSARVTQTCLCFSSWSW